MQYQWVIARYGAKSANGTWALTEAKKSIGYILINADRGASDPVIVAFKRPMDGPLPSHLDIAKAAQVERFETITRMRSGGKQNQ